MTFSKEPRMKKPLLLTLLLTLSLASGAWGATRYVDNSTVDGGAHCASCATPIDTDYDPTTRDCGGGTSTVYEDVQDAMTSNRLADGDTLVIMPGTYVLPYAASSWYVDFAGDNANVTVTSYSGDATGRDATILQKSTDADGGGTDTGRIKFNGANLDSCTFKWITFGADADTADLWWGQFESDSIVTFEDCKFDGDGSKYAFYHSANDASVRLITFNRCLMRDFDDNFLYSASGSPLSTSADTFESCVIYNQTTDSFYHLSDTRQVIFRNNTVIRYGADDSFIVATTGEDIPCQITVENNIFVVQSAADEEVVLFGADTTGIRILANPTDLYFHGNIIYAEDGNIPCRFFAFFNNNYGIPVPSDNYWHDPNFTTYTTGDPATNTLTIAAGGYVSGRGTSTVPTIDFAGNAMSAGDVGAYTNPAKTSVSLTDDKIAFAGSSITYGTGASATTKYTEAFEMLADGYTVVDGVTTGVGGENSRENFMRVDKVITTNTPEVLFLSIGVNDIGAPVNGWAVFVSSQIIQTLDKINSYGIKPIWLGTPTYLSGQAAINAEIDTVNATIEAYCATKGATFSGGQNYVAGNIKDFYELNASWATDYYANIAADVHPNSVGASIWGAYAWTLFKTTIPGNRPLIIIGN